MSSNRNPSWSMTDAQLDDVVDQLLLHRYSKRPPSKVDVVRTGLLDSSTIRAYVERRWPLRGRYAETIKGVNLSEAGQTMRSNKLAQHIGRAVGSHSKIESNELVWQVRNNRTYEVVCYAAGTYEGARAWAFTLFGWTFGAKSLADLGLTLVGADGAQQAAAKNLSQVGVIQSRRQGLAEEIEKKQAHLESLDALISTVMSAAAFVQGQAAD